MDHLKVTKSTSKKEGEAFEARSDGWERFRSAVHAAAKSGPKHRTKEIAKPPPVKEDKEQR